MCNGSKYSSPTCIAHHECIVPVLVRHGTYGVLAVLAVNAVSRIIQVAASGVDEVTSPLLACLSGRWAENREFVRLAPNNEPAEDIILAMVQYD